MGFLKNIFKKKEGGTFFGNLLRVGANKISGGLLGTGAGIIPVGTAAAKAEAEAAAAQAANDQAAYQQALDNLKRENEILAARNQPTTASNILGTIGGLAAQTPQGQTVVTGSIIDVAKKNIAWIILAIAAAWYFITNKKTNKRSYSKK